MKNWIRRSRLLAAQRISSKDQVNRIACTMVGPNGAQKNTYQIKNAMHRTAKGFTTTWYPGKETGTIDVAAVPRAV